MTENRSPSSGAGVRYRLSAEAEMEFRGFIHNLLALVVRMNDVRAGYGALLRLSGSGFAILASIQFQEGEEGVGINQIAEHLHLSGSFVTIEVNKLVDAGLVTKRVNAQDKRRVLVKLSPLGNEKLKKLREIQLPVNMTIFGSLTPEEFRQLSATVERLIPFSDKGLALLGFLSESRGEDLFGQPAIAPQRSRMRKQG